MLNYIWAGMIALSFFFALYQDLNDQFTDRWQNDKNYEIQLIQSIDNLKDHQKVQFLVSGNVSDTLMGSVTNKSSGFELAINVNQALPAHWKNVANEVANENASGSLILRTILKPSTNNGPAKVTLPAVKWVKMKAITNAAIDMAETAVSLAIGLIGVMAFWLGLMQIGYKSGLIEGLNVLVAPIMRRLFPEVPANHPAMSAISMNMAANILGLGNAATPMGIKAMEELQKLNPNKDEATNAMCMFLAINTSSVQLLPPATLIALMGASTNELMIPIIFATLCSTIVAIVAGKWFSRNRKPVLIEGAN